MLPEAAPESALEKLLWGGFLLALCVVIHAAGLIALGRAQHAQWETRSHTYVQDLWLLVRTAWAITLLHLVEIALWAWFYLASGGLPDSNAAFYFSSVTYTTVGYGDVVLPHAWRVMSGFESLTGILAAGLSTGFFFNLLSRILEYRRKLR
jgi:hypothetical protein